MPNEADASDKVKRAFVRLKTIRDNIPMDLDVYEPLVHEYSEALRDLSDVGYDIEEFEIPQQWFDRRVVARSTVKTVYAKHRSVNRALFLTKLDAVLGYFSLAREQIGFTAP
jgi:hypothetical protein